MQLSLFKWKPHEGEGRKDDYLMISGDQLIMSKRRQPSKRQEKWLSQFS